MMVLSSEEKKQYSRHLILEKIGVSGQLLLKKSKVLVIGAGGLGCPVLQYLTAAGVGTIGIIDDDKIEQTNLQRQILYTHATIGAYKAEVAVKKLRTLNPYIKFASYIERITSENAISLFQKYDVIVDGSDNFSTRYLVNDAAVLTKKPVVFGSIFKFGGQVSVFNYKDSATYRCLYPKPPKPQTVPNCSSIGVLGVLPGIIGSLQANEVIKILCNIGDVLANKLLTFDALSLQQYILKYKKNESIIIDSLQSEYDTFCGVNNIENITAEELKQNKDRYAILDVRTHEEFISFNIGGLHIPLDKLQKSIMNLSSEKSIVVCCQSGIRSNKAITMITAERQDLQLINLKNGLSTY